jgi:hypothetical protein
MEPTTIDRDTTAAVIPSSASQVSPEVLEQVLIGGDLSRLTETQRLAYYRAVCQRLGLNPLSNPFEYLRSCHHCQKGSAGQAFMASLHPAGLPTRAPPR